MVRITAATKNGVITLETEDLYLQALSAVLGTSHLVDHFIVRHLEHKTTVQQPEFFGIKTPSKKWRSYLDVGNKPAVKAQASMASKHASAASV